MGAVVPEVGQTRRECVANLPDNGRATGGMGRLSLDQLRVAVDSGPLPARGCPGRRRSELQCVVELPNALVIGWNEIEPLCGDDLTGHLLDERIGPCRQVPVL